MANYDLVHLEAFVAVARSGSFRTAATNLAKSQPAVSKLVKFLEEDLEVDLFDRSSYRAKLTIEGQKLLKKAELILESLNDFENSANFLQKGMEPVLDIAIDYMVSTELVISLLKDFTSQKHETEIKLHFGILDYSVLKVLDGEADFAITSILANEKFLDIAEIGEITLTSVVSPNLVDISKEQLSYCDLEDIPQIITNSTHGSSLSHGIRDGGKKWYVSDHQMKEKLIMNGLGWGTVNKASVQNEIDKESLIELNLLERPSLKQKLYVVKKRDAEMGPVAKKIWQHLKN